MNNEDIPSAVREGKPGSSMYPESSLGEIIDGIATGREVDWEPLVDYRRNGVSRQPSTVLLLGLTVMR